MIRLAVSPLLIGLGITLTAHFLASAWTDWSICFKEPTSENSSAYWDYLSFLLFHPGMAALTLGAPFLPFLLLAAFLRAPERIFWQWVGIGATIAGCLVLLSGISSGQACPDEGRLTEYGIPELILVVIGGGMGFAICLVVTYIGSIRHSRRKAS